MPSSVRPFRSLSTARFWLGLPIEKEAGWVQRTWQHAKREREREAKKEREREMNILYQDQRARERARERKSKHACSQPAKQGGLVDLSAPLVSAPGDRLPSPSRRWSCQTIGRTPLAPSAHFPLLLLLLFLASHERGGNQTRARLSIYEPRCLCEWHIKFSASDWCTSD